MLEERICIYDSDDYGRVEDILDEEGYDYDWDGGDRLMCSSEDVDDILSLLNNEDIECDLI